MKIKACYISHPGLKRTCNQDNLYYQGRTLPQEHSKARNFRVSKWDSGELLSFGVFDGMGGEQYGELASFIAATSAQSILKAEKRRQIPSDLLYEICKNANEEIWKKTMELQAQRIGTTMAFVMLQYNTIWCCNVGDSRIYRLRDGELTQMSMDHVAVNPEHPERKPALSMHLGMGPMEIFPNPYMINETIKSQDLYLICSDGITDMIGLSEIRQIIGGSNIRKCVTNLLKEVLNGGGLDNATMILIKVT